MCDPFSLMLQPSTLALSYTSVWPFLWYCSALFPPWLCASGKSSVHVSLTFGDIRTISSSSLSPFDVDVESAPSEVQIELIDLQCSNELKSHFAAVGHTDFWRKHILLTKHFPGLVDNVMRTVAAFGSSYCCEQLFSRMKLTKSKSRVQLTDGHLNDILLLSVSSVIPDISSVSVQKQHQVSHFVL